MRYIRIPERPIQLVAPETDLPVDPNGVPLPTVTPADVFRALFKDPRMIQALDTFAAYDLRSQLIGAKPGDVVAIRDDEHEALRVVVSKPQGLSPMLLTSHDGVEFLRAIAKAPEKDPRHPDPRPE